MEEIKLEISVAHRLKDGKYAVFLDGKHDSIFIGALSSYSEACLLAAARLREAAKQFEDLAKEPAPSDCDVHGEVNG